MAANNGPKVLRARLNQALAKHLINDFNQHGAEVIAKLRRDKPAEYLKMATTAFQGDDVAPVGKGLSNGAASIAARAVPPPRGPKLWLLGPESDEISQTTARRPFRH